MNLDDCFARGLLKRTKPDVEGAQRSLRISREYLGDASEDEIRKHYRFYYQKSKPIFKIRGQVNEVVEANIFEREDEYIVGNRDIWEQYSKAVGPL